MKIVLVGGGSLGPVTPLLAVAKSLRQLDSGCRLFWMGTPHGPERGLIEAAQIDFESLPVAKLPRYLSFYWITFLFKLWQAGKRAGQLLDTWKPDVIATVGGFTAVPVVLAAKQRGIPCLTHQLDVKPGLANRIIARFCVSVTTSFPYRKRLFGSGIRTERIPTPVRFSLNDLPLRVQAVSSFGLDPHRPITLVFGGGQGAEALNKMIDQALSAWLAFTQIIHIRGLFRINWVRSNHRCTTGYSEHVMLEEDAMLNAYAAADLLIVRGGMGTFSEGIAALKKAAIVIPIPDSHQEANAQRFGADGAALTISQKTKNFNQEVLSTAQELLANNERRQCLGTRAHESLPTDDGTAFAEKILHILLLLGTTKTPSSS